MMSKTKINKKIALEYIRIFFETLEYRNCNLIKILASGDYKVFIGLPRCCDSRGIYVKSPVLYSGYYCLYIFE